MKFKTLTYVAGITLSAALAIPIRMAAQEQPKRDKRHSRYKLIDVGTFGGPNSFVNGPYPPSLSANGTFAGAAETSIPDPFAPNCQNGDCLVQHAQKWHSGVVTDLGTLPGVNLSSGATWISTNGIIVGGSGNGLIDPLLNIPESRGVLWTEHGKIVDLGTLMGGNWSVAFTSNDRAQVAGVSTNSIPDPYSMFGFGYQTRGFLWQNGVMHDLGTLGGPDTVPQAINQRGQIVGTSYTNFVPNPDTGKPTIHPFLWENGTMVDLGSFGGAFGMATFVNSRGQVVGGMDLAGDQRQHPFLWDRGVLKDLGTLGGDFGIATWINDAGVVVGGADTAGNQGFDAFLWKNGVMIDLGLPPNGDLCDFAYAVNSKNQVVGVSECSASGGPGHAFLWENGSILDLNALILPGSNIEVEVAFDINDRGEIAAQGVLPNGNLHACLLVPASEDEIAAAAALPTATTGSEVPRRVVTTSDDSIFEGRKRMLNRLRRVRGTP